MQSTIGTAGPGVPKQGIWAAREQELRRVIGEAPSEEASKESGSTTRKREMECKKWRVLYGGIFPAIWYAVQLKLLPLLWVRFAYGTKIGWSETPI